jgi:hypothetical protein
MNRLRRSKTMKSRHLLLFSICLLCLLYPIHYFSGQPPVALDSSVPNQYCTGCHNQKAKAGGLMLDSIDYTDVAKNAETWEKVVRKIKTGMMPPSGARRPERGVLDAFATEIEKRLDAEAALHPNPGRAASHRLNRSEYGNVIRDLLALDIDVATMLPQDDATEGFDNIADALGTSPSLIQGYISAAMKISRADSKDKWGVAPDQSASISRNAVSGNRQERIRPRTEEISRGATNTSKG